MEVLLERLHLAGQLAAVRYLTEGGPQATGGIYKNTDGQWCATWHTWSPGTQRFWIMRRSRSGTSRTLLNFPVPTRTSLLQFLKIWGAAFAHGTLTASFLLSRITHMVCWRINQFVEGPGIHTSKGCLYQKAFRRLAVEKISERVSSGALFIYDGGWSPFVRIICY